jgi:hypothetical protein
MYDISPSFVHLSIQTTNIRFRIYNGKKVCGKPFLHVCLSSHQNVNKPYVCAISAKWRGLAREAAVQ